MKYRLKKVVGSLFLTVGMCFLMSCGKQEIDKPASFSKMELEEIIPYDQPLWVEGLCMKDSKLMVGSGLKGGSFIGTLDLESNKFIPEYSLSPMYYGEGIAYGKKYLYQLTYQDHVAFQYDEEYHLLNTIELDTEGWGLAYDQTKEVFYQSDGSNTITIRDEDFQVIDSFDLTYSKQQMKLLGIDDNRVNMINELEVKDHYLYANLWEIPYIIKINLDSKQVESIYDLTFFNSVYKQAFIDAGVSDFEMLNDYYNGIAYIKGDEFYLTVKNIPIIIKTQLK